MLDVTTISNAIKNYVQAKKRLRELGIAVSERQIVGEIGEWLVLQLYGGERAESRTQPHWNIINLDGKIQVKAHAKGNNTPARWTTVNYPEDAEIDVLIIIIFSQDFTLKEFYKAPWCDIQSYINRTNKRYVIHWNDLSDYRISIDDLPNQEFIELFN